MFFNLFSRRKISGLGKSLVAIKASGSRVPKNCFGLDIEGESLRGVYREGGRLRRNPERKTVWLHPGPYKLRFAPHPDAPAVGVELEVAAQPEAPALAGWLNWQEQWTVAALLEEVRQTAGENLLLPAMSREEMEQAEKQLSERLARVCGFTCAGLRRVRLTGEAPAASSVTTTRKAGRPKPSKAYYSAVGTRQGRLIREITEFSRQLRSLRSEQLPFFDEAARTQWIEVEDLLDLCQQDLNFLPGADDKPPQRERKIREAKLRQIDRWLGHCWPLLQRFDDADMEAAETQALLAELKKYVQAIERSMRRRIQSASNAAGRHFYST